MSIATELAALAANKIDIKAAIEAKQPAIQPTDVLSQWPQAIASIAVKADESKPVRFIDYDGTVLHSYTATDAQALTELPALPQQPNLTCQGWNYTLQQMKDTVSDTGYCDVGAMYIPTDGKTHIHITIRDPEYSLFKINFIQTISGGVTFNWGDGSLDITYSGTSAQTVSHQYSPNSYPQSYDITLDAAEGSFYFPTMLMGQDPTQSSSNPVQAETSVIDEVNIGNGISVIEDSNFRSCYSLKLLTIPNGITSIKASACRYCTQLPCAVVPSSVTSIGQQAFINCYSMKKLSIPPSITALNYAMFSQCHGIQRVALPYTITRLQGSVFNQADTLQHVAIPSSLTRIEGGQVFNTCVSLNSVTIPAGCTIASTEKMFLKCAQLHSLKLPAGTQSVKSQAFSECYGILIYDFTELTAVPALENVNAFEKTNDNKKIVVPDDLYSTWTATSPWDSSTNGIAESIVKASEL